MWIRLTFLAVFAALVAGNAHAATSSYEGSFNATRASSIFTTLVPCPPADLPLRPAIHKPRLHPKPRVRIIPIVQSPIVRPEGVGAPTRRIVHRRGPPLRKVAAEGFKTPQFLAAAEHRQGRCETLQHDGKRPLLMSALAPDAPDEFGGAPGAAPSEQPAAATAGSAPIDVAPKVEQSSPFFGFPGGYGGGAPGGFAGGGGGGGGGGSPTSDGLPNVPGITPSDSPPGSDTPPPGSPTPPPPPISDVPEPGVWALLLGGFAAIGVALRASRRRDAGRRGMAAGHTPEGAG
jgi:uncharacterized membrane protein YgcG